MKNFILTLFFFTLHVLSFAQYNPEVHGVPEVEYNALMAFYNATDGDSWTRKVNWLSAIVPVSEWYGVTVEDGHVTRINVIISKHGCNLPEEFFNLNEIKELTIINGGISGTLSEKIVNFQKLEILSIMNGSFTKFPKGIATLTNLKEIDLSGFNDRGSFPDLSNIKGLTKLTLSWNYFDGEFPLWVTEMENLEELDLERNYFTGIIPAELNNMKKLRLLRLRGNTFDPEPVPDLRQMDSLRTLDLYNCNLEGEIPVTLTQIPNIASIDLSENNLTGKIPTEFSVMTQLTGFQLNSNKLDSAKIPDLSTNTQLRIFSMSECNLIGEIPQWVAEHTGWTYFNVWNNNLTGKIPGQLLLNENAYLYLFDNDFSGFSFSGENNIDANLGIRNNKLEFDDIVPVVLKNSWVTTYAPQDSISTKTDTTVYERSSVLLDIDSHYPGNTFQWFKNDTSISASTEESSLEISNIKLADAGKYICHVSNPSAPDLTLYSYPITLSVAECETEFQYVDTTICEGTSYNDHFEEGTYTDTFSNQNGCDSVVISTIKHFPGTISTITIFADTLRCDLPYLYYQWFLNDQPIVNSNSFRLNIAASGNYYALGTDNKGCINQSETIYVIPTGSENNKLGSDLIAIYPNMINREVMIKMRPTMLPLEIMIANMNGKIVGRYHHREGEELHLDLSTFNQGLYFISIEGREVSKSVMFFCK